MPNKCWNFIYCTIWFDYIVLPLCVLYRVVTHWPLTMCSTTHHTISQELYTYTCTEWPWPSIKWRSENSPIINIQLRNYLLALSFLSLFSFFSLLYSLNGFASLRFGSVRLVSFFCMSLMSPSHLKLFIRRDAVTALHTLDKEPR